MGPYIALIVLIGLIFGLCWLIDKGFNKAFRSQVQYATGKAVRLNKKYGSIGLIVADLVLIANGIVLLALLSMLGATLTLPGLAGIALTVGMAVDANIIIFERMKEEQMHGITVPKDILTRGFAGSFSAILDGQLTTLFAALFLFWLGSGPVR